MNNGRGLRNVVKLFSERAGGVAFITASRIHAAASRIFVTTPVPTVDDKYMKLFRFE